MGYKSNELPKFLFEGDQVACNFFTALNNAVLLWLSLLHNFIQRTNSMDSLQVPILLATCWRFLIVETPGNYSRYNKTKHALVAYLPHKNYSKSKTGYYFLR